MALAQTPPSASPQSSAALSRFEEGKKRFDEGKFEEALLAFQASLEQQGSPNTRLYIGRCFRALGRVASAYTSLRLASREAQDRLGATGEKRFAATRDAAAGEAAELEPKVPRLTLAVPSDAPPGFVFTLDGAEIGKGVWGTALEVDPGTHRVEVSGPRLRAQVREVEMAEGAQLRVDVPVERLPTARLTLVFAARPAGMSVEVDGKPVDPAIAASRAEIDVGRHRVMVRAPGHRDFAWEGAVRDGDDTKVAVKLVSSWVDGTASTGTPRWLFFGTAGAALVAAGVGTVFAVQASGMAGDEEAKDPLLRTPEAQDDVGAAATRANVLFIVSGALAAGTAVLFFTTDWRAAGAPAAPRVGMAPWLAPSGGGLSAWGAL